MVTVPDPLVAQRTPASGKPTAKRRGDPYATFEYCEITEAGKGNLNFTCSTESRVSSWRVPAEETYPLRQALSKMLTSLGMPTSGAWDDNKVLRRLPRLRCIHGTGRYPLCVLINGKDTHNLPPAEAEPVAEALNNEIDAHN